MGRVRIEPRGEVLPAHEIGAEAAANRNGKLGADDSRDHARAADEAGRRGRVTPARIWRRIRTLLTRGRFNRDLGRELESHLAMESDRRLRLGLAANADEARRATLRDFGSVPQIKEEVFDVRGITFWDTLWQDIRFGVRTLGRAPA